MLSREFVGSLGDSESPPRQWVIYNPVCYKTSQAGARIRLWPTAELMDHHISLLIECKLEKYTSDVSIHHEKKAHRTHTRTCFVCLFVVVSFLFKYVSLIFTWRAFACVRLSVRTASGQAAQIYEVHRGERICILNLNYTALFVYQPEQMEISYKLPCREGS